MILKHCVAIFQVLEDLTFYFIYGWLSDSYPRKSFFSLQYTDRLNLVRSQIPLTVKVTSCAVVSSFKQYQNRLSSITGWRVLLILCRGVLSSNVVIASASFFSTSSPKRLHWELPVKHRYYFFDTRIGCLSNRQPHTHLHTPFELAPDVAKLTNSCGRVPKNTEKPTKKKELVQLFDIAKIAIIIFLLQTSANQKQQN